MSFYSPQQAYLRSEQSFLEEKVESATPVQLVCMLYEGALQAIQDAQSFLTNGDILARGRAVSRAQAILVELNESLKEQYQPEVTSRLRVLYDYAIGKLQEGHAQQEVGPLKEAEAILRPLYEAWQMLALQDGGAASAKEPQAGDRIALDQTA